MIPQVQKSVFIYKLLSSLNNLDYGSSIVRYVIFKARESKSYFGVNTEKGYIEKLEGKIVVKAWKELPQKFPNCILGDYIVKPDSFSGIIMLDKSVPQENQNKYYFKILSYFKNRSTVLMNKLHGTHGRIFWQNNYEEVTVNDVDRLREVLTFLKAS